MRWITASLKGHTIVLLIGVQMEATVPSALHQCREATACSGMPVSSARRQAKGGSAGAAGHGG